MNRGKHAGVTLDDRYALEQSIGSGGLGEIYRARHLKMGRNFAVKLLHPRLSTDPQFLARFDREARALSRLRHPCCVAVTDYGHSDELGPYIVMELLTGELLSHYTRGEGIALGRAIELIRSVLSGLEHAHEQGIVHRDLKPDNIILVSDSLQPGRQIPKILDFGVAKIKRDVSRSAQSAELTAVGLVLGTPAYMAPEQLVAENQQVDARADLYAVGVILYELCCGQRPFNKRDPMALLQAHLTEKPPSPAVLRPALPTAMVAIIEQALQRKPDDRFPTAASMNQALADLPPLPEALAAEGPPAKSEASEIDPIATDPTELAPSQVTAPTAAFGPKAKPTRSHPKRRLLVLLGVIMLVGLVVVGLAVRHSGRQNNNGLASNLSSDARAARQPAPSVTNIRADGTVSEEKPRWSPSTELQVALRLWGSPRTRRQGTRKLSAYLARHREDTEAQLYVARKYLQAFWAGDGIKLVDRALKRDPKTVLDPATLVSLAFAYKKRAHWRARRIVERHAGSRAVCVLLVGAVAIRDQTIQRNLLAHVRFLGGAKVDLDRDLFTLAQEKRCGERRGHLSALLARSGSDPFVQILRELLRSDDCLGSMSR